VWAVCRGHDLRRDCIRPGCPALWSLVRGAANDGFEPIADVKESALVRSEPNYVLLWYGAILISRVYENARLIGGLEDDGRKMDVRGEVRP
jgi:hypothetical protein